MTLIEAVGVANTLFNSSFRATVVVWRHPGGRRRR
jgi:hypothetical protein